MEKKACNPLQPSVDFLYSLKISENLWFSDVFRRYRKATPGSNGLSMNPANNYLFRVNNRNTRRKCEICSKLTKKTPEQRQ